MPDYLDDPRLFLRIVEAGSMKAVAEEIEADPAAVTRRLSALEKRLGVKLIERSRKGSVPTEAGAKYYQEMRHILPTVDAIEAEVANLAQSPRGLVRVSCPLDFGARYVTQWFVNLQRSFPELDIDLLLCDAYLDLVGEGIDVALRFGDLSDSAFTIQKLGEMQMMIVGAPSYLNETGRPKTPKALLQHQFILYSWMRFGRNVPLFGPKGKTETIEMETRLSINNVGAIREALLLGAGLHIGPQWIFAEDIAAGRLEHVLKAWAPKPVSAFVLYRQSTYLPAKTRVVVDELLAQFAKLEGVN